MSNIELRNVTKEFQNVTALNDVSFEVKDGEFFVLLGPTGAGKTTTLRIIAGLEKQEQGDVVFNDEVVNTRTPADRDVAFVFQQYSLYPNMTVYDNMAFPLRSPMRRTPDDEIKSRVEDAADKLRITHLLERKTSRLSGGEMQRVSIGRAIVREPRIFLMDEPLSNLDAKLRESLRVELQHLQKTLNATTLFVTHDQIEALTMADRIAVLNEGTIAQIGTPEDIYDRPATTFVAKLVGSPSINMFTGERSNGQVHIADAGLTLPAPECDLQGPFLVGIRPEDVKLEAEGQFKGELLLAEPLGVETILHIRSGEQHLVSLIPGITEHTIGENISFSLSPDRLHYFTKEGQRIADC